MIKPQSEIEKTPFMQAMQAQQSHDQYSSAILTILKNNDILSISIFKNKYEYQILRKNIQNSEMVLKYYNYFNLVAIGMLPAIFSIIDIMCNWPFFIKISFDLQDNGRQALPERINDLHQSYAFEIEITIMMEGLIFVALFFISQYFIKQKKVSMVFKLRRYFLFLCILYTLMLSLEIFVSYESIKEVV